MCGLGPPGPWLPLGFITPLWEEPVVWYGGGGSPKPFLHEGSFSLADLSPTVLWI